MLKKISILVFLLLIVTAFVTTEESNAISVYLGYGYGSNLAAAKVEFDLPVVAVHGEVGYNGYSVGAGLGVAWNFINIPYFSLGLDFDCGIGSLGTYAYVAPALLLRPQLKIGMFRLEAGVGGKYIILGSTSTSIGGWSGFGLAIYAGIGLSF